MLKFKVKKQKVKKFMGKTKYFAIAAAAVVMASCGSNSKSGTGEEADSVEVARVEAAAANSELWSEEVVEKQVREMFSVLNDQYEKDGYTDCSALDIQYCTKYYLSLVSRIREYDIDAVGDMRFMGDEGWHWSFGIVPPYTVENVKVDLLSGDQAQAQVRLVSAGVGKAADDEDEYTAGTTMILWLEDGQWKINNWLDPEVYADNGYLGMMEDYIRENNIPE